MLRKVGGSRFVSHSIHVYAMYERHNKGASGTVSFIARAPAFWAYHKIAIQ